MWLSIRGAAYYGASLHITIALLFLGGFFIDVVGISEVWHNPYATYFSLILAFIYICLFLVFGLLIFRGVELESTSLLKGSIAGFLVLQISAFCVYLCLLALTHYRKEEEEEEEARRKLINNNEVPKNVEIDEDLILKVMEEVPPMITLLQVIALVFGIATTFAHVAIVVTYVRNLSPGRRRG